MKGKRAAWPLVVFAIAFAVTRIPNLLPGNLSAAYALAFCAGVYFTGAMTWWFPLGLMLVTDLGLNCYYQFALGIDAFHFAQLFNYAALAALILLGRAFRPRDSWLKLLGGGILGAILFYFVTNTAAWLFNPFHNPEYTKTLFGWMIALTKGTGGYPETWEFFRNTLLGGGLFTGLFVGAMKFSEAAETDEEEAEAPEDAAEPESEESQA